MKPGQESKTSVFVCTARAIASEEHLLPGFSDPTAIVLLPDDARAMVQARRSGRAKGLFGRARHEFLSARATVMAVRTRAIDEAIRAVSSPQVVILGAGLDGRAWRMPELRDATVFEVDHPDTQRAKRARIGSLTQEAREVKFVPVDFTRDDLAQRLAAAGHDPAQPTTWIWEGVVMYLTPAEVEATLRVIKDRSAPRSRLVILYIGPGGMILPFVSLIVRGVGEPLRSSYRGHQMRALLARYGFEVRSDNSLPELAARSGPAIAKSTRRVKHLRTVVADVPAD